MDSGYVYSLWSLSSEPYDRAPFSSFSATLFRRRSRAEAQIIWRDERRLPICACGPSLRALNMSAFEFVGVNPSLSSLPPPSASLSHLALSSRALDHFRINLV